jgi:hypothetical protein
MDRMWSVSTSYATQNPVLTLSPAYFRVLPRDRSALHVTGTPLYIVPARPEDDSGRLLNYAAGSGNHCSFSRCAEAAAAALNSPGNIDGSVSGSKLVCANSGLEVTWQ